MSLPRSSFPCSTCCITEVQVNSLEIDPIRNMVRSGSTGFRLSKSANPYPLAKYSWPSFTTDTVAPATCLSASRAVITPSTNPSSSARSRRPRPGAKPAGVTGFTAGGAGTGRACPAAEVAIRRAQAGARPRRTTRQAMIEILSEERARFCIQMVPPYGGAKSEVSQLGHRPPRPPRPPCYRGGPAGFLGQCSRTTV